MLARKSEGKTSNTDRRHECERHSNRRVHGGALLQRPISDTAHLEHDFAAREASQAKATVDVGERGAGRSLGHDLRIGDGSFGTGGDDRAGDDLRRLGVEPSRGEDEREQQSREQA